MAISYQYDANGYFVGAGEDYGYLPSNATRTSTPQIQPGHALHWTGTAWEQVESHKGEQGYVDGQPHTIRDHGPYPDGWSTTPPPPTPEEIAAARRNEILARIKEIEFEEQPRCLREIALGAGKIGQNALDFSVQKLAALDAAVVELRTELAGLG